MFAETVGLEPTSSDFQSAALTIFATFPLGKVPESNWRLQFHILPCCHYTNFTMHNFSGDYKVTTFQHPGNPDDYRDSSGPHTILICFACSVTWMFVGKEGIEPPA